MKKEIADLWVKELESGFWEQGKYFLEHSQTYCVFGVLVNLAAMNGVCAHKGNHIGFFDGEIILVPESVMKWAELNSPNGELHKYMYSLAELNDRGKSFKYLADVIKRHWKEL